MADKRVVPHNIEAEKAVIGSVLLNNNALTLIGYLSATDFYDPRHRVLFEIIRTLESDNNPIDSITMEEELRRMNKKDAVGELAYLSELAMSVPVSDNIEYYATIVKETCTARDLMSVAAEVTQKGYEDYGDLAAYLDEAEAKVFSVTQRSQRGAPKPTKDLLIEVFDLLDSRSTAEGGITGIPTLFADLDKTLAGLQPSELTILAARPSMGKTSLAMSIAQNCATEKQWPVLVFSLEMSSPQLMERMLCSEARVDSFSFRRGTIKDDDMNSLTRAADHLAQAPILIDDTPALTLHELRAKSRRFRSNKMLFRDKPFGLIVVDYLQLMQGNNTTRFSSNREQEISEISRGLKALAKEINCPVLALSQLNRSLESRPDKRPMMSDLRESGAIEQDADLILFIYRDEVYSKDDCEFPGIAEIIIGKNRHGPITKVDLRFEGKYTRFENLSKRPIPPQINDYQ